MKREKGVVCIHRLNDFPFQCTQTFVTFFAAAKFHFFCIWRCVTVWSQQNLKFELFYEEFLQRIQRLSAIRWRTNFGPLFTSKMRKTFKSARKKLLNIKMRIRVGSLLLQLFCSQNKRALKHPKSMKMKSEKRVLW